MPSDMPPPDGYKLLKYQGAFESANGPYYYKKQPQGGFLYGFWAHPGVGNFNGIIHGGALFSFADTFMGLSASMATRQNTATVSMNAHFIAAGPLQGWIEGEADIRRQTQSLVFIDANVSADGTLLFTASGIWKTLRRSPRPAGEAAAQN